MKMLPNQSLWDLKRFFPLVKQHTNSRGGDELDEELNPGIPPSPEPKLPGEGPTTSEDPNLGGNI